jgi:peroxiredoxin
MDGELQAWSRMQETQQEILKPGTRAPEFTLSCTPDQKVSLSELKGSPVVLIFFPADWSPVCSDELAIFSELVPEFKKHGAEVFGISVDGIWCHLAFEKERNLRLTLLADFEPKGEVAKAYGAYRAKEGVCERALYVIDKEGVIAWSYKSPIGVNPGADGVLEALEKLSGKESKSEVA